tara:strand:- start:653 stop:1021 length:369 start_codon:yes stop_codon:yes gene_type:complete
MFNIPVSNGEIIDKYTILEIKLKNINDEIKLKNIKSEHSLLKEFVVSLEKFNITGLLESLRKVNSELWEIEDKIREKEKIKDFGIDFIELARSVYKKNDERFNVKNQINIQTNSDLKEEKSY